MAWPQPTRDTHEKFCLVDEWTRVRDALGRAGTHHVTYELALTDGRVLRTRVSHPVDRTTYGASLWSHILRDQLEVEEREFWACVRHGVRPARGQPEAPVTALPVALVSLLIRTVGLTEAEVMTMTKDEAVDRLNRYWTEGA